MSGAERGVSAAALRAALAAAEPIYAAVVSLRNRLFDLCVKRVHRLPRPTISVGNLTTGGVGKTPLVRWLAETLRDAGRKPAILSRGYKSAEGELGDEQRMLQRQLNRPGAAPVFIYANPRRVDAAALAAREHPEIDVFLLDDGFQHRTAGRDLDIVLVNAAAPFGFGHVLPRGMLRERLSGLKRAGAVVLTHADRASPEELQRIEQTVRRFNPSTPIFHATHALTTLRLGHDETPRPIDELKGRRCFAFCGIGDPDGFFRQLEALGQPLAGRRVFADHYDYDEADLAELRREADGAALVTTEKDWAKLSAIPSVGQSPLYRADMAIRFRDGDERKLLGLAIASIGRR